MPVLANALLLQLHEMLQASAELLHVQSTSWTILLAGPVPRLLFSLPGRLQSQYSDIILEEPVGKLEIRFAAVHPA